jgi:hypothetical protein
MALNSDDFNRANANLTTPWTQLNNPRVLNNACEATSSVPFSGTTLCSAVYQTPLDTDMMLVQGRALNPGSTKDNTKFTFLTLRQTSTLDSGTKVGFGFSTTGGVGITTWSGSTTTARATDATNVASGDLVSFLAVDNVYTGYVNGSPVVSWEDTGRLMTIGQSNRYWGLFNQVTGNLGAGSWTYALDYIIGRDLIISSGAMQAVARSANW